MTATVLLKPIIEGGGKAQFGQVRVRIARSGSFTIRVSPDLSGTSAIYAHAFAQGMASLDTKPFIDIEVIEIISHSRDSNAKIFEYIGRTSLTEIENSLGIAG